MMHFSHFISNTALKQWHPVGWPNDRYRWQHRKCGASTEASAIILSAVFQKLAGFSENVCKWCIYEWLKSHGKHSSLTKVRIRKFLGKDQRPWQLKDVQGEEVEEKGGAKWPPQLLKCLVTCQPAPDTHRHFFRKGKTLVTLIPYSQKIYYEIWYSFCRYKV